MDFYNARVQVWVPCTFPAHQVSVSFGPERDSLPQDLSTRPGRGGWKTQGHRPLPREFARALGTSSARRGRGPRPKVHDGASTSGLGRPFATGRGSRKVSTPFTPSSRASGVRGLLGRRLSWGRRGEPPDKAPPLLTRCWSGLFY